MALERKQIMFGVQAIVPYHRTGPNKGRPYGLSEVVGSAGLELAGEVMSLTGGSNRYPWQTAHGFIEPKIALTAKEFPSFFYELFLGVSPAVKDASGGLIEEISNVVGSGLFDATGKLVRGISITDANNLKYGTYLVVYNAGGPSINVFASASIDNNLGDSPTVFADGFLKINETALAVAQGADINIAQLGVTLDVATTAEGFDATSANDGDSFMFTLIPPSGYYRDMVVGRSQDRFPEFGLYMYSEKGGDNSAMVIDAFKCKANGLPHTMGEKAFTEAEINIVPSQDGDRGVCRFRNIIREAA